MAFSVLQAVQSAGSANNASSPVITAATAGNILVSMMSQSVTAAPTVSGYTVNATQAVFNTSAASVNVGYKIAAGGETGITWTPGTSGTVHGVTLWEIAGAPASIILDATPVHTDNLSAATGGLAVTTSTANSIILLGVGGSTSSGTISPWTGTNVATNISTAAARCFGGSFITTTTVSSTFTANWATSGVKGMLAIIIRPAAAATTATGYPLMMGLN